MSNIDLVHMLGDAMAVPLRAATLLHESVEAFDEIAEDAAGDAASLALAATERAAFVAAANQLGSLRAAAGQPWILGFHADLWRDPLL